MALSCSRRKYSRWFFPTSDCTCDWIFDPSSRTSSSLISSRFRTSMRARMSSVSSTSCLTAVPIVVRLDAMKSASLPGIGDVGGQRLEVVRQERRERHDLLKVALDVPLQRVDLEVILVAEHLLRRRDGRLEVRAGLHDAIEPHARQPLHDQPQAAVGQLEHLVDVGCRSDRIEVVLRRVLPPTLRAA